MKYLYFSSKKIKLSLFKQNYNLRREVRYTYKHLLIQIIVVPWIEFSFIWYQINCKGKKKFVCNRIKILFQHFYSAVATLRTL